MPISRLRRPAAALTAVALVLPLSACGSSNSSSSSKPQYCQDRQALKKDISNLSNVNVVSNGLPALQAQLVKIRNQAEALVSAAKSDFPQQTSAISSSINTLEKSISQLGASPSVAQLTGLATEVSAVATAIKNFNTATQSKCS